MSRLNGMLFCIFVPFVVQYVPIMDIEVHGKWIKNINRVKNIWPIWIHCPRAFVTVLENSYNEHIVYDADGKILYVNPACIRHYGLKPEEMINRNNADVYQGYWTPPGLDVFMLKRYSVPASIFYSFRFCFYTIGVPVLNEEQDIEMIIGTVQEEPVKEWDVDYNKKAGPLRAILSRKRFP